MDNAIFSAALAAVSCGDYCPDDVKKIKQHLTSLTKQELALKRQMEKNKNDYAKSKGKTTNELKSLRKDIKEIQSILKTV